MSKHDDYLFVYGTLLSNIPSSMSKFLRRRATLIGKATISGKLIDLGGYPGLLLGGGTVKGELYRFEEGRKEESWSMLDAYESVTGAPEDEYRKEAVAAQVNGGGKFSALTYVYVGSTRGKAVIPNGDYPPFYKNNPEHRKFTGDE